MPVPPQNEGARTRSSDEPSSNVSAYMSMYVHAQASATSLHRTLNLSANKYYSYDLFARDDGVIAISEQLLDTEQFLVSDYLFA